MVKWKIAVVDDDPQDTAALKDKLNKLSASIAITCFESGEKFLSCFHKNKFDIIFLDIYMNELSGIETAARIRKSDKRCPIVFITTSPDHALESYRAQAVDYILKPVEQGALTALFEQILQSCTDRPMLKITADRKKKEIPLEDILYVSVNDKTCHVHTADEVFTAYTTIEELNRQLGSFPFLRCHQSFIVNMDYIANLEQDFHMISGEVVYVRQSEYEKIRRVICGI